MRRSVYLSLRHVNRYPKLSFHISMWRLAENLLAPFSLPCEHKSSQLRQITNRREIRLRFVPSRAFFCLFFYPSLSRVTQYTHTALSYNYSLFCFCMVHNIQLIIFLFKTPPFKKCKTHNFTSDTRARE